MTSSVSWISIVVALVAVYMYGRYNTNLNIQTNFAKTVISLVLGETNLISQDDLTSIQKVRDSYSWVFERVPVINDVNVTQEIYMQRKDGPPIRAVLYFPDDADDHKNSRGLLPGIVWFHGGGWVIGTPEGERGITAPLANQAKAIVVSVDYRLAPEHKFPAALSDCMAAVDWVAESGNEFGIDTTKLVVGGISAGGNLAAVIAQHTPVELQAQLLLFPALNAAPITASWTLYANGYLLTAAQMLWNWHCYLDDYSIGETDLASPLRSPSDVLKNVPKALIIVGEYDILRDEAEEYAKKLHEVNVKTVLKRYNGCGHGCPFPGDGQQFFVDFTAEYLHKVLYVR